jgi:hypothetical protein
MSNSSTTEHQQDFRATLLRRASRMPNDPAEATKEFLNRWFYEYIEHSFKDRCSFLHYLGLLASSGRVFGVRARLVIGFVNGARTAIPRCMEPPVLFDHCRFRGCDAELEKQRLELLDQLRHCRYRRYRLYLLRSCPRLPIAIILSFVGAPASASCIRCNLQPIPTNLHAAPSSRPLLADVMEMQHAQGTLADALRIRGRE